VCNAKEHAKKLSYKEMAAQIVNDLKNSKFSLKIRFLLAITFDSWRFMGPAMARWKVLEK
jgi:hypothetical protein